MTTTKMNYDLRAIASRFLIYGDFQEAAPYGSGHINDTYAAIFDQGGSRMRYILQRINHRIFKNPSAVMENIGRVTAHVRHKLELAGADQISRRVLTLVATHDGRKWLVDGEGNHWRCYLFIEQATTYDQVVTPRQAYEAARAFGEFQKLLADLPEPRLRDTVPNFHHTRLRYDELQQTILKDPLNRAAGVRREIEFCLAREAMVDVLLNLQAQGLVEERVTHNDTKLDNAMIDDATGEGICVVDLDTVMPGLVLHDFGDLCRSATRPTVEDERDLSRVMMRLDFFEALAQGYLAAAGEFLNATEKEHLVFSARLITLEIGMRFLTDYLQGDGYFKIHREGQNADRARVQFKMVESFEHNQKAMDEVIRKAIGG